MGTAPPGTVPIGAPGAELSAICRGASLLRRL